MHSKKWMPISVHCFPKGENSLEILAFDRFRSYGLLANSLTFNVEFLFRRMRKILFLQFSFFAVIIGLLGSAAFGLLLWDFQFPGTFMDYYLFRGGMSMNLILLVGFGLQHSLMARKSFKRALVRLMPAELERSFYVMVSGFVLFTLSMLWSPMSPPLYDLSGTIWGYLLHAGAGLGIVVLAWAGWLMDGLDLIGLRSFLRILNGKAPENGPLRTPGIYRLVRHPLYFGMLLMFWLTPTMTHDHLFFAEVMTAYLLVGIHFEERDLVVTFGDAYRNYQREVPMLIPFLKIRRPRREQR
jgi:protein-S-isoprenylcysteine O-methyltransferase Ste14